MTRITSLVVRAALRRTVHPTLELPKSDVSVICFHTGTADGTTGWETTKVTFKASAELVGCSGAAETMVSALLFAFAAVTAQLL